MPKSYAEQKKKKDEEKVVGQQQKTQPTASKPIGTTSIPKSRTQSSAASSSRAKNLDTSGRSTSAKEQARKDRAKKYVERNPSARNYTNDTRTRRSELRTTKQRNEDERKEKRLNLPGYSASQYDKNSNWTPTRQKMAEVAQSNTRNNINNYSLGNGQTIGGGTISRIPDASNLPMIGGVNQINDLDKYKINGQFDANSGVIDSRERAEKELENILYNRDAIREANRKDASVFNSLVSGIGYKALDTLGNMASLGEKMTTRNPLSTEGMTPDEIYNRAMESGNKINPFNYNANDIAGDYNAYKEYVLSQMESGAVTPDEIQKMKDLETQYSKIPAKRLKEMGLNAQAVNEGLSEGHPIANVAGQMVPMIAGNALIGQTGIVDDLVNAASGINNPAARFAATQAANLVPDLLVDTAPEALANIAQGKSAGEVGADAVKNIAINELANLGFEYGPQFLKGMANKINSSNIAKKTAENVVPEVNNAISNVAKQADDIAEQSAKNVVPEVTEQAIREEAQEAAEQAVEAIQPQVRMNPSVREVLSRDINKLENVTRQNPNFNTDAYVDLITAVDNGDPEAILAATKQFDDVAKASNLTGHEALLNDINKYATLNSGISDVAFNSTLDLALDIDKGLDRIARLDTSALSEAQAKKLSDEIVNAKALLEDYKNAAFAGESVEDIGKEIDKTLGRIQTQASKLDGYDNVFENGFKKFDTVRGRLYGNSDYFPKGEPKSNLSFEDQDLILDEMKQADALREQNRFARPANQAENAIPNNEALPEANTKVPSMDENLDDSIRYGKSKVVTNSAVNADIIDADQLKNDPVIKDIMKYEKHSNVETLDNAMMRVNSDGKKWKDDIISGKHVIDNDTDVDTAMLLMQDLNKKIANATDDAQVELLTNQKNAILSKLREFGTKSGQNIQAFAKWNNTADGALLTAIKVQQDDVIKPWKSKNQKQVKGNSRIAQALAEMGNDTKKVSGNGKTLTHDQIKEGVLAEIEKEFGSVEDIFTDNDLEYLARLAEDKEIPVWKITDEIEHRLNHGTWYTLDEALPEKTVKNKQISRMLDNIINGKKAPKEKAEQTIGELLTGIKNTLNDESIGVADRFTDDDVYFLSRLIQEDVPKWQIEDELAHKLNTGSWYAIDESIEAPRPINQKLNNALKAMLGEGDVKAPKAELSLNEIREQVKNTLEREAASFDGEFTDSDIDYLANLINNNAGKSEITDALNTKMATGNFGITAETQQKVNDLFKQAELYDPNSKQFVECQAEAYRLLAEEVAPDATGLEKFNAWRYMAMLGNPKTMLRNYIGNKMFGAVTGISNNIAAMGEAGIDKAIKAAGGEGIQRTKSVLNPIADSDLIKASNLDADASRYRQMVGSKYEKMDKDALRQSKSVFKSKLGQLAEKAVDAGISDYHAIKNKYTTSLAGYLKANGYDKSIFDAETQLSRLKNLEKTQILSKAEKDSMERLTKEVSDLEKARDFALKQAEYSTFHEDNKFASWLTKISRDARQSDSKALNAAGTIIEGVVPFKKTPANVLRSGVEYSPLGAIDSIRKTGKLVYENTGKRAGNLADTYVNSKGQEVARTLASDVIESWSKTLTGTGLTALGFYLYNKGILRDSDKETKYQDQLEGLQNYSIKINGKTYTVDWAAPAVMPLLLGAEISKVWNAQGNETSKWYDNIDEYLNAANRLADPIIETSMLSGIQDALETAASAAQYNETLNVPALLAYNSLTGYATQAVPTIGGQIARTIDPTRRSTYTDKEGAAGIIDKQAKKIMNKTPFLSMLNQPYVDTYGREQQNSPFSNPLANLGYQMFSPGYLADVNTTDADRLSREMYEATGNESMLPKWESSAKIDGERVAPNLYTDFAKAYGQANYDIRNELANNEWFNSLSEDQKAEILSSINTLAKNVGQAAIEPGFSKASKPYEAYSEGGVPGLVNYYQDQELKNAAKAFDTGNGNLDQQEKLAYINSGLSDEEALKAWDLLKGTSTKSLVKNADGQWELEGTKKTEETKEESKVPEVKPVEEPLNTANVATEMRSYQEGGNVDLFNRPSVPTQQLRDAGWNNADGEYATVFSSTYSNADETDARNFTPIAVDSNGNVTEILSPEELQSYAEAVIDGRRQDDKGLQMGGSYSSINDAVDAAIRTHELQEEYYNSPSQSSTTSNSNLSASATNINKKEALRQKNAQPTENTTQESVPDLGWSVSNGSKTYDLHDTKGYQRATAAGISDDEWLNAYWAANTNKDTKITKGEAEAYIKALGDISQTEKRNWFDYLIGTRAKNPY